MAEQGPSTIVLDGNRLEANRTSSDPAIKNAISAVRKKADQLVKKRRTYSVTNKSQTPPSGDKHDYMSQGPYWWPDPAKPNGLPYIRRDGERNPELLKITDSTQLRDMMGDAETLALAFYFTRDERYSALATNVIRTWFLDPRTRQNPNLNFGQGIPGVASGRGIGLIETRGLYRVIDAAKLLEGSRSWTKADSDGLKSWFTGFLKWMTESPIGKDEADERNNHGTYYDVQVISYAVYTGQPDLAVKQIEISKARVQSQIEPDGSQPHELARTLSWGYTNMNLYGFFTIARLAENVGVDLWKYESPDERSIRNAFIWLLPFIRSEKEWTYKQIKPREFEQTARLLNIAARKYKEPVYRTFAEKLGKTEDFAEILGH
jgi:Alginate lyase.